MSARPARYDVEERHRIGRFEANFVVAAEDGPLSTPERLAHQVRAEILPALEDVFADDDVVNCDARIETLEIDLGAWPADPDWPSLRDTLRVQLLAALAPYLRQRADAGGPAGRLAAVETRAFARPSVDDPAAPPPDADVSRGGVSIPLVAQPDQDAFAVLRAAFGRGPQGVEKAFESLPDGSHRQAVQRVLSAEKAVPDHAVHAVETALIGIFTGAGHTPEMARRNAATLTARLLMHPKGAGLLRADADAGLSERDTLERSRGPSSAQFRTARETDVSAADVTAGARDPGYIYGPDTLRADWKATRASVAAFLAKETAEGLLRILEHLVPASTSGFHQSISAFLAKTAHRQRALLAIVSALLDETPVDIEALRSAEETGPIKDLSPEPEDAGVVERNGEPAEGGSGGQGGQTEWARVLHVLASEDEAVTSRGAQVPQVPRHDVDGDTPVLFQHRAPPEAKVTSVQPSGSDAGRGNGDEFPPHAEAGGSQTSAGKDQDTSAGRPGGSGTDTSHISSSEQAAEGGGPSLGERGAGSDPAEQGSGDALETDGPERMAWAATGASGDLETPTDVEPAGSEPYAAAAPDVRHGVSEQASKRSADRSGDTWDDETREMRGPMAGRDTDTRGGRERVFTHRRGTTDQTGESSSPDASEEGARGSDTGRESGSQESHAHVRPSTPPDRLEATRPVADHLRAAADTAPVVALVEAAFGDAASDIIAIADMIWGAVPTSFRSKSGMQTANDAPEKAAGEEGDIDLEPPADVLLELIARAGPAAPDLDALLRYIVEFASPDAGDRQTLLRHVIARLSYPVPVPVPGRSPGLRHQVLRGLKEVFDEREHPVFDASSGSETVDPQTPEQRPMHRILSRHAGLVLFHPYYKLLFSRLQLLTTENELQPDQLGRARCVLATLAGEAQATAPIDPLARILLGVPDDVTPPPPVPLTEDEAQLIEGLIRSVIAQWSTLGQTSPAGLQDAFIRRDGQLWLDTTGAHLRVDPGPFDVLLDSLPWSLDTVVALPWMPVPCHVMWRTQDG